jgi:hypothetical protein
MTVDVSGGTAVLRPRGIGRYVSAAFLTVWLAGWLAGELFALAFLFALLRSVVGAATGAPWPVPGGEWIAGGAAAFSLLFLVLWLMLWTVGGVAAIQELFRSLAGEDRISLLPAGVEVIRRAGPFRRTRVVDRPAIRRVRARRHDRAIVADTRSRTELLTTFGTDEQRLAIVEWLTRELSLSDGGPIDTGSAPAGWSLTLEGGRRRLTRMSPRDRHLSATVMWVLTALAGLAWVGAVEQETGAVAAGLLTAGLAAVSSWVAWSRRDWLAERGELTFRRQFATWTRDRVFRGARLEVDHSVDSDGDSRYELQVVDPGGARAICSELNDDGEVTDTARWLAAVTGFPLTLPPGRG